MLSLDRPLRFWKDNKGGNTIDRPIIEFLAFFHIRYIGELCKNESPEKCPLMYY